MQKVLLSSAITLVATNDEILEIFGLPLKSLVNLDYYLDLDIFVQISIRVTLTVTDDCRLATSKDTLHLSSHTTTARGGGWMPAE